MAKSSDYVVRFTGQDDLSKTTKQIKDELNSVGSAATTAADKIDTKFNKIINSSAPLKRQLRDLQAIMAEMNMKGLSNTDQFTVIAQKAGEIKDAINDAATATQKFANDTMNLQAGIQAFQGLAAAGGVATGVMALFGTENENVARAIQKTQGVLAIMNGVQQIANILNKDSALMLKLKQVQMNINNATTQKNTAITQANNVAETIKTATTKASTAATVKNTVAEGINTTATTANTVATQAWNVAKAIGKALLGDWSGLLLVGAGVLGTYAIATANSTEEQEKLNGSLEKGKSAQEKFIDILSNSSSEIADQKTKLQELNSVLNNTNVAMDLRRQALEEIKKIIPGVNAYIDQEGVVHGNVVTAIYKHIQALDKLQKAMALFELKKQLTQDLMTSELKEGFYQHEYDRYTNNQKFDESYMAQHSHQVTRYKTVQGDYLGEYKTVKLTTTELDKQGKIAQKNLKTNQQGAKTNADSLRAQRNTTRELKVQIGLLDDLAKKYGITQEDMLQAVTKGGNISNLTQKATTPKTPKVTTVKPEILKTDQELNKLSEERLRLEELHNKEIISDLEYKKRLLEILKKEYSISEKTKNLKDSDVESFFNNKKQEINTTELDIVKLTTNDEIKILQDLLKDENNDIEEIYSNFLRLYDKTIRNLRENFDIENEDVKTYLEEMIDSRALINNVLENLKLQAEVEKKAEDLLTTIGETPAKKEKSSFEKAVEPYQEKKTRQDELSDNLDIIQNQMNQNDEFIKQLEEIKALFEAIGFTGSDAYEKITEQLGVLKTEQTNLGSEAEKAAEEQEKFRKSIKTYNDIADAAQNVGSILSDLGQAAEDTSLQTAGIIAEAIANIIAGYAKASEEAGTLGPWEWAAFSLAGLAQVASVISQIHSLSGYAEGGIVNGSSYYGDNVLARLNSGEMVLNERQQSNLFKAIDSGDFGGNSGDSGYYYVDWRLKGSDLYGSLKNYSKTVSKTGKITGIK